MWWWWVASRDKGWAGPRKGINGGHCIKNAFSRLIWRARRGFAGTCIHQIVGYILYVFEPSRRDRSNGAIFKWFGWEPADLEQVICEFQRKVPFVIDYTVYMNTLLRYICCRIDYYSCPHSPTLLLCYRSMAFYYTSVHKTYDTEYNAMYILFVAPLSIVSYHNVLYHSRYWRRSVLRLHCIYLLRK